MRTLGAHTERASELLSIRLDPSIETRLSVGELGLGMRELVFYMYRGLVVQSQSPWPLSQAVISEACARRCWLPGRRRRVGGEKQLRASPWPPRCRRCTEA